MESFKKKKTDVKNNLCERLTWRNVLLDHVFQNMNIETECPTGARQKVL